MYLQPVAEKLTNQSTKIQRFSLALHPINPAASRRRVARSASRPQAHRLLAADIVASFVI